MFSHIMIGANDIEASKKFYDAVLGALGCKEGVMDPKGRCFYIHQGSVFGLSVPIDGNAASKFHISISDILKPRFIGCY